jgi:type 1 glutamine amidotransferase
MRYLRWLLTLALLAGLGAVAGAADPAKPKRLLMVTHSAGFMHDSIRVAEEVVKEIGPKNGFEVTCYRYTADPDAKVKVEKTEDGKKVAVELPALQAYSDFYRERTGEKGKAPEGVTREQCGRINADTLKKFDAVLFFTQGKKGDPYPLPMTEDEEKALVAWVKAGGAFAGTHCATDTMYTTPYGELIGGTFNRHPWHQKIKLHVEDASHPGARGFKDGDEITDEIYQFTAPYSRDKLHIIVSINNSSIDTSKGAREDKDYAIAWCQEFGKGKVYYTALGHRKEVWRDARFQESLMGGLSWAVGRAKGDATPSGMAKSRGPD